ncbi:histone deacetylase 4 [Neocloeon triangulifer]|uniref:histone deacetylase 4 n=1 Tax=Neocloeon triangulifer TaxID=2078957 RepID=UPI00286F27D2|nr:histone deacetylase 4 [Neocloeon triangulifer]
MALDYGTHSFRSHRKLEESASTFRSVEITSASSLPYSRHSRKEMAGGSPLSSPVTARRTEPNGLMDPMLRDQYLAQQMMRNSPSYAIQQQMLQAQMFQLKKQQQLQQQILHEQFQAQKQQLAEQHEQQLRQHLKNLNLQRNIAKLWEQKKLEEERERREQEKLEMLRKKDKHEQSAIASSEVKQKLQGFLLNKQAAKAASAANVSGANGVRGGSPNSNSQQASQASSAASSTSYWSGMQPPAPQPENPAPPPTGASPYPRPQALLGKYDDDVPLRRTASEPNLKVRLKQRVIDRRNSPLIRRKDRLLKRKSQLAMDACNSPESGPNSPPTSAAAVIAAQSARGNTPIQEVGRIFKEASSPYAPLANSQGSMNDLSQLYSSPSMPNISLGRPHVPSASSGQQEGMKISPQTEAEVRAAYAARYGLPLTGQMLQNSLPFYPTLPVIDGDYSNPSSPSFIQKQMQALEQAQHQNLITAMYHAGPITDQQVAHAHLNKGARPLGRTKSAPLPLGHPMLQGSHPSNLTMPSANYQEYLQEKQMYDQQQQHNLLKQHIRKTVLTRASGRNASAQLDEAVEVDDSAEDLSLNNSSDSSSPPPLVIDLTDRKSEEDLAAKQQREREQYIHQQQQRDLLMRQNFTLQISEGSAFTPRAGHMVRPLSRALSSPLVALVPQQQSEVMASSMQSVKPGTATALAYDGLMLKHQCICGDNSTHPEHSGRLQSIWARLAETGLMSRCLRYRARKATLEEIQSCHSEAHALLFGTSPQNRQKLDVSKLSQLPIKSFVRLPCGGIGVDSDTTWNELHTSSAASMAVGCVVDLATKSASGEIKNGFAIVRPPGHHAEPSQAMGFCFFNSVAIAARQLQQRFDLERILILDWDVHHGNGTQQIFYNDPRVLYLSIHRHDDGNFFPGTGGPTECGADDGMGFNVNVAWSGGLNPPMGDAEYLAAFRTIIMPIVKDFDPEIVLVSAGFDACSGHSAPLGGYQVSAACFGYMTHQLMQLAGGKVILALEGGYDLPSICDAAQECVKALTGEETSPMREEELCRSPNQNAIDTLQKTIAIQNPHWPCIKKYAHTVSWSAIEASQKERDESETVTAMASLSMKQHGGSTIQIPAPSERQCTPMEEPMDQDDAK